MKFIQFEFVQKYNKGQFLNDVTLFIIFFVAIKWQEGLKVTKYQKMYGVIYGRSQVRVDSIGNREFDGSLSNVVFSPIFQAAAVIELGPMKKIVVIIFHFRRKKTSET